MEMIDDLKTAWNELRKDEPKLRIRDAAGRLGVSEAELLATGCGGNVTRLRPEWPALLERFKALGRVMCLTRNEHAVHERKGLFREIGFFGGGAMGQVVGPDIDLRLFPREWREVFAVRADEASGAHDSVQIFGRDGTAILKVFLQPESDRAAFDALIAEFASENQETRFESEVIEPGAPNAEDAEVDVEAFRQAWRSLEDTHAFFGLLKRFRLGRVQALRLAGAEFAEPLALTCVGPLLERAAAATIPIMVFVGNRGCIQIHTGPVETIRPMHGWLNVLDPDFNLHLREEGVASVWIVRKPTTDGFVTSVELYDTEGENIALLFGKRKPGTPEDPEWRALAEDLRS